MAPRHRASSFSAAMWSRKKRAAARILLLVSYQAAEIETGWRMTQSDANQSLLE
jgi:hypothetical protein